MKGTVTTSVIALLAGLLLGYWWFGGSAPASEGDHEHTQKAEEGAAEEKTWTCSMHPQVRQDEPGQCPICGMDLIPVDEAASTSETVLEMSEAAVSMTNIQTTEIQREQPEKTVRMQGEVEVDERRISLISARFPGRLEKLHIDFTGQRVQKGQKLASIYSPELISAQKELFEALQYKDSQPALYKAARKKLQLWDLTEAQIERIEERDAPKKVIDIVAPHSGVVTERRVTLGEYVKEGTPLFELADLSRVWVVFDAYEQDLPWLQEGDKVEFTVPSKPGETFRGRIDFIDPVMKGGARTVEVRVDAPNADGRLRPEMFVRGQVEASLSLEKPRLVVPHSAVLWTGERSVVYVAVPEAEAPTFEFREVLLGNDLGGAYIVEEGLNEGESVVTHGVFKVDAAAQLAGKRSMMNAPQEKGNAGMNIGSQEAVPASFKAELGGVYEAYFRLKNALVASEPEKAVAAAEQVLEALGSVPMGELSEGSHEAWMKSKSRMETVLKGIAGTNDLDQQRDRFVELSETITDVARGFGVQGRTIYVDFCPMANDDKGAHWLSTIEEIRNPYYGEEMMTCGEVQDTLGVP